jgi:exodeoxyribonuclease-1
MQGAWREVYARPAPTSAADVDEDLYGGFVGNDDRRKLERLRRLPGEQLAGQRVVFDDPRLEEILFRYRARNFADTLSAQENERWVDHCSARLHEGAGGSTTLAAFFERIDQLNEEADERGQEILGALYDYAEQIAPPLREGA